MPMSTDLRRLRERVGHERLVLPAVTGLVLDARGDVLLVKQADSGAAPDETGLARWARKLLPELVRERGRTRLGSPS